MKRIVAIGVLGFIVAGGVLAGVLWPMTHSTSGRRYPGVVEIQEIRLGSKIGGRVSEVLAAEGDIVEAGQPLLRFERPELDAQRRQLVAELAKARAEWDKARNGARVEEKEASAAAVRSARARFQKLKAGWRSEEIRQARAELAAADADLLLANEEFDRVKKLYAQRAMSKTDMDNVVANRDRASGRQAAAKARADMMSTGSRREDLDDADGELQRMEATDRLIQAGVRAEDKAVAEAAVEAIQAKIAEVDAQLCESEVRAPSRAIVEVLAVRKGDLVPPHQPVLRVLKAEDLWVKIYVPETELGLIKKGEKGIITIDSFPGRVFHGTVTQIASISEFTPRNVQSVDERQHQVFGVKVKVDDPEGAFKAGMAATVFLSSEKSPP